MSSCKQADMRFILLLTILTPSQVYVFLSLSIERYHPRLCLEVTDRGAYLLDEISHGV